MPEEVEVETRELQETIEELHEERHEREEAERRNAWTRYIALTTALLAVFAAIGAMQSGALVNEAMIQQIKAADKWNEYQAARLKDHTYTIAANTMMDAGAAPPAEKEHASPEPAKSEKHAAKPEEAKKAPKSEKKTVVLKPMTTSERVADYAKQIEHQQEKEADLSAEAKKMEAESEELMHHHHRFAMAVAYIQVAIALSAVAALARMKPVWVGSIAIGLLGIYFFASGMLGH